MWQKWAKPAFNAASGGRMSSFPNSPNQFVPESKRGISRWYALKVRTRSETFASGGLHHRGYESFLPTYLQTRRYSDRTTTIEMPAFAGYVFCRFDVCDKAAILGSPGVQYIVSFGSQPAVVPDESIQAMRRILAAGAVPTEYLSTGTRIRITSGPLAGIEGVLIRVARLDRIVVSVHILQRSVAVELSEGSYALR